MVNQIVFFRNFFKAIKNKKYKSPLILICSLRVLKFQMKKLKFNRKIKLINIEDIKLNKLSNNFINLIDVNYKSKINFGKISKESNPYIKKSFETAFKILKSRLTYKLINGPISKKFFLGKKFLGITEYISQEFKSKKFAMLIFNKKLSVCPITTHTPLKLVTKSINQKIIMDKIFLINAFFKKRLKYTPKIALLGLNPHCETTHKFNEDEKILKPLILKLKKRKLKISGPYPADTCFLKNNRIKFDVIVGMYHDQVLTPIKTLFEYDAVNITLGLPFIRISPDHGPNEKMVGKNASNPLSLIRAIEFLDKN